MSSRLPIQLLGVAVIAGAALAAFWMLREPETPADPPRAAEPAPTPPVVDGKPAATLQAAPSPTRSPTMPQAMLRYPDGTYMPALNGVQNPAALHWPAGHPFTPIVGKRLCGDTWWYEHADGTMSTCEMKWRSDLGRPDALSHVAVPKPALPVEPPDPPTEQAPKR